MSETIQREIVVRATPEEVWRALTDPELLAEWMYPNDFEPRVGHRFTFTVPANPRADFDGIVHCEVLRCDPPERLAYSWSGGAVVGTHVSYELAPEGSGTRIRFEHAGFDLSQSWGQQALAGAEFGWKQMLARLGDVLERSHH